MIFVMFFKSPFMKFTVSLLDGLHNIFGDFCDKGFTTQIPLMVILLYVYIPAFEDD